VIVIFIIIFSSEISSVFQKKLSQSEIVFLKKEAYDGNMSAADELIFHYAHMDDSEKAKFWAKKRRELERNGRGYF